MTSHATNSRCLSEDIIFFVILQSSLNFKDYTRFWELQAPWPTQMSYKYADSHAGWLLVNRDSLVVTESPVL